MDLGTTIISIIIILICILPFYLMGLNNKKRERKLKQELFSLAENNKCKIMRHDLWNNSSIGIDDAKGVIFFIKKVRENESQQKINLDEIQKCRIVNNISSANFKAGSIKATNKLELAFSFQNQGKDEIVLSFYDTAYDSLTLTGELQIIEKWHKIINEKISERAKQLI